MLAKLCVSLIHRLSAVLFHVVTKLFGTSFNSCQLYFQLTSGYLASFQSYLVLCNFY